MIVLLTAEAEADIEAIGDWIAKDSPARALTFVAELYDKCITLAEAPLGYSLVPRYESSGIRRRVHGNYLIFYRIAGDQIEILHVLHGARNYESLLFPEE